MASSIPNWRVRTCLDTSYIIAMNHLLREDHVLRICETPFRWCVYLREKVDINCELIKVMVSRWADHDVSFRLSHELVPFTVLDVFMTTSFGIGGLEVPFDECIEGLVGEMFNRKSTSLSDLVEVFNVIVVDKNAEIDVVCRKSKVVANMPSRVLDDLDSLCLYDWATGVHKHLVDNLNKGMKKLMAGQIRSSLSLSGNLAVLQAWAVERFSLDGNPINRDFPRMLRWFRYKARTFEIIDDIFRTAEFKSEWYVGERVRDLPKIKAAFELFDGGIGVPQMPKRCRVDEAVDDSSDDGTFEANLEETLKKNNEEMMALSSRLVFLKNEVCKIRDIPIVNEEGVGGLDEEALGEEGVGGDDEEALGEEPLVEGGVGGVGEEPLVEEGVGVVDEEPLVEEGVGVVDEEPLGGEECVGGVHEEPLVEEGVGVVDEEPLVEEGVGVVDEEPLVEEGVGVVDEEPLGGEECVGGVHEEPLVEEGVGVVDEEPLVEEGVGVVDEEPLGEGVGGVHQEPLGGASNEEPVAQFEEEVQKVVEIVEIVEYEQPDAPQPMAIKPLRAVAADPRPNVNADQLYIAVGVRDRPHRIVSEIIGQTLSTTSIHTLSPRNYVDNMLVLFATTIFMHFEKRRTGVVKRILFSSLYADLIISDYLKKDKNRRVFSAHNYSSCLRAGHFSLADIPTTDFLFLPFCHNYHWWCYVVKISTLELFIIDSMAKGVRDRRRIDIHVAANLAHFFCMLYNKPEGSIAPLSYVQANIPSQPNLHDCGVIMLQAMELWDGQDKFNGTSMPQYSNEVLLAIRKRYVTEWILDEENIRLLDALDVYGML
ncbi:hypothetical protein V8G54_001666 [Vigna mungo]|uniref:Ubiquitin-like protease family profile domain-containing protein n=1 Tax=Vigna mungo TaxID=3915 RepID=A0AAQ3P9V3_VIGMU